jgi:hypothetical protein
MGFELPGNELDDTPWFVPYPHCSLGPPPGLELVRAHQPLTWQSPNCSSEPSSHALVRETQRVLNQSV